MQLESEVHGGELDVAVPQESGTRRIARASGPPVEAYERWHRLAEVLGGSLRERAKTESTRSSVSLNSGARRTSHTPIVQAARSGDRVRPRTLACVSRRYDPIGASRLGSWA